MASGPITSWQIDGETVERVADFSFLGSKITADGEEIKRRLLFPASSNCSEGHGSLGDNLWRSQDAGL